MLHARDDYNRIQDPENKIPADEPVFLVRSKDFSAPAIVSTWVAHQLVRPDFDMDLVLLAVKHIKRMHEYQAVHTPKVPDL